MSIGQAIYYVGDLIAMLFEPLRVQAFGAPLYVWFFGIAFAGLTITFIRSVFNVRGGKSDD